MTADSELRLYIEAQIIFCLSGDSRIVAIRTKNVTCDAKATVAAVQKKISDSNCEKVTTVTSDDPGKNLSYHE